VISNVVSSQVEIHAAYGGVYPLLAKRAHAKNLPCVFEAATKKPHWIPLILLLLPLAPVLIPACGRA